MIDIKQLALLYFSNDEPVTYKLKNTFNGDYLLKLSPILVKNWTIFESCLEVLLFEQQDYNDIEIIQMSYLDFILKVLSKQTDSDGNQIFLRKLFILFKESCGLEDISYGVYKNKNCLIIMEDNKERAIITSKEFDEIKEIMLHQNKFDYDNRYVNPEVKKLYETYIKSKNKNVENPTLEKQKIFVLSKTGITMKDINNMTYRAFSQVYRTNVQIDLYFANKMLQANERIKEDIIYPLFEKEKDKYADIFVGMNKLAELGISGTEQLQNMQ